MTKLLIAVSAMLSLYGTAQAQEHDSVFDDNSRSAAKTFKTPDELYFRPVALDSKGRSVRQLGMKGTITKDTKVFMGVRDKSKKKWLPGEPLEGGVKNDLFTDPGTTLRLLVTMADNKIQRILVIDSDWKLEHAEREYDAIYKGHGAFTNGRGSISYVRVELDEKRNVIKTFGLTTGLVVQETKIAKGKYNAKEKTWEAGEDIPKGVYGDIFKDAGAKSIFIRITPRDDNRGIAQILVCNIGAATKKQGKTK